MFVSSIIGKFTFSSEFCGDPLNELFGDHKKGRGSYFESQGVYVILPIDVAW